MAHVGALLPTFLWGKVYPDRSGAVTDHTGKLEALRYVHS